MFDYVPHIFGYVYVYGYTIVSFYSSSYLLTLFIFIQDHVQPLRRTEVFIDMVYLLKSNRLTFLFKCQILNLS